MRNFPRRRAIFRLAILAAAPALGAASRVMAASQAPIAIKGYDPVAYFTVGKPVRGQAGIAYDWDEKRYLFSRAEHRELFKGDPLRYAPQFPDFCAMSLTRGEIVEANPENWLIADGRLYMFGKSIGPAVFKESLAQNVAKANQNRAKLPKR